MRRAIVCLVLLASSPAHAEGWNPLRAAAKKLESALGHLVESATAPTLRDAEESGHRLLHDADASLGREITRAGSVTTKVLAAGIDRADRSLEARILQVHTAADETLDRGFGRLDHSIGLLDDVARRRIAQIFKGGHDLIAQLDKATLDALHAADQILAARIEDLGQLVRSAIDEADAAAEARIAQLDETLGRRIGTLDTIATKQTLSLEASMLRLAALIGMIAFIGFVLWRLFAEVVEAWGVVEHPSRLGKMRRTATRAAPRFLAQVLLAGVGAGALYLLSGILPRDAHDRADRQIAEHQDAMAAAMRAYDFDGVRYHAAQLELLDPAHATALHATAAKAELLRDVFTRPGRLDSMAGVRALATEVNEVASAAPGDRDVLVVEAFITWQVGASRGDEHDAAALCAQALDQGGDFLLAPLAASYLRAFLHDPYPATASDLPHLREVLAKLPELELPQLQHVLDYDRLVAALDSAATPAYLDMLSAHADVVIARAKKADAKDALARRLAAAQAVIAAWTTFDEQLQTSPSLADDITALSAFTLDDASLTRALWFVAQPDIATVAPEDLATVDPRLRVQIAPLRVAWAQRYAALIGPSAGEVLSFEESQRFADLAHRARTFDDAYVTFLVSVRTGSPPPTGTVRDAAAHAAEAAADLGLYKDGVTAASLIEADLHGAGGGTLPPDAAAAVDAAYQQRTLRFL